MRIDTDAAQPTLELDPRARLRHYIGAFKRRWYLILVPLLLGSMLGWFSAPGPPPPPKKGTPVTVPSSTFYEATHVLIQEAAPGSGQSGGSSAPPISLAQAAYLVNTGEVPVKVSQKVGLPVDEVQSRLLGTPRDQVSSIEVKAVGKDPAQVVVLSDSAATALLDQLRTQAEATATTQRDKVVAQLDDLNGQLNVLNAKIAANPPDRTQLEAQQRSLSNQYSVVYEQFTNIANTPPPSAGLTTLEGAKAKAITEDDYKTVLQTIRDGAAYVTGAATTVPTETAAVDTKKESTGPLTRSILGGIVGLGLGVGLVLLLDRFDARLRRREDVEAASGLTVIAEIPRLHRKAQRSNEVQSVSAPRSRAAESYRVVRGAALYALSNMAAPNNTNGQQQPAAVLMVTSADAGEGKTLTTVNLAAVFAESGFSVLVVNCDFRRPKVHQYLLGVEGHEAPAVADVLAPRMTTIDRVHLVTGFGEGSADANPAEVVATQQRVIDAQRGNYDVILLDTAPFLATNDASELLSRTDLVAVVVRSGKTTRESAFRTAEVLERFSAPILGTVFNGSDENRGAQYYYYYHSQPESLSDGGQPPAPPPDPAPPSPPTAGTSSADPAVAEQAPVGGR